MIWFLNVSYADRGAAQAKGAHWDASLRSWIWTGDTLPAELEEYEAPEHSWERWCQDDTNGGWWPADSTPTATLRPHQEQAAAAVLDGWSQGRPGFLLADDVGLGKTLSAVAGANAVGSGLHILVLAPLSVVAHWRRSIDAAGNGGNRWCVTNYERAKKLLDVPATAKAAKKARTKNKHHAAKGRSLAEWDIIICDEAHRLRNPVSQRSAAVRQLIKSRRKAAFTIWLSATAGQNPLELSYLATLLADVTGVKVVSLDDFEEWCKTLGFQVHKGAYGAWLWDRDPADLSRVRDLLFAGANPAGLRRRPHDLAGWPELNRVAWPVQLDGHERRLYDQAWDEFRMAMLLEHKRASKYSKNALTAALRFRQKASLLRAARTAELAADIVEDGLQVAISVAFLETGDEIAKALGASVRVVHVNGQLSAAEREVARIAFQRGQADVVIFTVTEGISLHAGEQAVEGNDTDRALLIHDLRWSALELAQIEGRCHRDGRNAVAYHLYAEGTVETDVAVACMGRLEDMGELLGDDTTGIDALMTVAQDAKSVRRLAA